MQTNEELKYYRVNVPRGHVGAGRSRDIIFYIKARSITMATSIARKMPGVKHSRSVYAAQEITRDEYIAGRQVSAYER